MAICPHKLDYFDTCAKLKEKIRANQTKLNRIKQTGSPTAKEMHSSEYLIHTTQQELEEHKQKATKSHAYYRDMVDRCSVQWQKIQKLEGKTNRSADDERTLKDLKSTFTLTSLNLFQIGVFHLNLAPRITFKNSVTIFWGLLKHATHTSTI